MASHEFAAYEGPENYIFVSYAHKDAEKVLPVMTALHDRGYRIWYDEGIIPGSEWPENIAQHLNSCALFLAFVTPNSMASANCRREINFALAKQKPFLSAFLEPTQMPLGMELQLSAQQSVLLYNFPTWERFIDKICGCPDIACCRALPEEAEEPEEVFEPVEQIYAFPEPGEAPGQPASGQETAARKDSRKPGKKGNLTVWLAAAALLAVVSLLLLLKPASAPAPSAAPGDSVTVYARIPEDWSTLYCWAWGEGRDVSDAWQVMEWNGSWYAVELPDWVIGVDISNGDVETGDIMLDGNTALWVVMGQNAWDCFDHEPTQLEIQQVLGLE